MIADIIEAIGTVFGASVGWITTLAGFIVNTPIVLFFIALIVVGIAIGWIKRFVPSMGGKKKRR